MVIRDSYRAHAEESARRILANKARYQEIEAKTGVPWWWIGCVHKMESNLSFNKHLHNGDSLTRRTWRVPAGRPARGSPPFTFEESAIDALLMKRLDRIGADGDGWSLESVCFYFELYNGFGYRYRGLNSPYLWSGSQHHTKGKYVRDGVFDPNATSQQTGCMVVLAVMMEMDGSIEFAKDVPDPTPEDPVDENEMLDPAPESSIAKSRTVFGLVLASAGTYLANFFHWTVGGLGSLIEIADTAQQYATDSMAPVVRLATLAGIHAPTIGVVFVIAGILYALYARTDAHNKKKIG